MSSFKTLAGRTTTSDAELFTIRLSIAKATSMAIEHIILITDSLESARRAVDPSVHPGQAHSLAVCSALRLFFSQGHSYRIDFWDCPSKAVRMHQESSMTTKCVSLFNSVHNSNAMLQSDVARMRKIVIDR